MLPERWKEIVRPYYLRWFHFPLRGGKPSCFDQPWEYPALPLTASALQGVAQEERHKPSFLFLPMSDWHSRLQRPQHLAMTLANRGHACYFLNPHLGRQFPRVYALEPDARAVSIAPRITELHVRVPAEPVYHHRLLTRRESMQLADSISELAAIESSSVVQIVSFPSWGEAAIQLRRRHGWPIIYDCHDLLSGFGNVAHKIVEAEQPLLSDSDFVLFSSVWLERYHRCRSSIPDGRTALLRNAAHPQFLQTGVTKRADHRTTAGYFGALDRWFDIDAVRRSAEFHPDVRFQLIGRVEFDAVHSLRALANVELTGEVPHAALPSLLAGFDVGLIPFQVNDLTRAANPIKLYEYFSAGIPVVSTRLPEVEEFGSLVYVADTPDEFASCVRTAIAEKDPLVRAQRKAAAAAETWEHRATCLIDIARGLLSTPTPVD